MAPGGIGQEALEDARQRPVEGEHGGLDAVVARGDLGAVGLDHQKLIALDLDQGQLDLDDDPRRTAAEQALETLEPAGDLVVGPDPQIRRDLGLG